jgi:hypothetical protein
MTMGIGLTAKHVTERINAEGGLLNNHRTQKTGNEEASHGGKTRVGKPIKHGITPAQSGWQNEAYHQTNPLHITVL